MFGAFLKELVQKKYDKFSQFAEVCNISKGHLNDIFSGRILPKEKNLTLFIKELQPLSKEQEQNLKREWAFDKSEGILREEFYNLKQQNQNMLKVLSRVKNERELINKVDTLKQYEDFYNLFFKGLNPEQTKSVLTAILKELKIIALDNNKQNELKNKFDKLESIINKIKI